VHLLVDILIVILHIIAQILYCLKIEIAGYWIKVILIQAKVTEEGGDIYMIPLSLSFVFPIFHFKLDRVLFHVILPYLKYNILLCHFMSGNGGK